MKHLILLLSIVFTASMATAQSVSIAPTSFQAWGKTPAVTEFGVGYKDFSAHYFHVRIPWYYKSHPTKPAFAISYKPIIIKNVNAGAILFDKPFPVNPATRLNFIIEARVSINSFEISYQHISNGFGKVNPGIDTLKLTVKL